MAAIFIETYQQRISEFLVRQQVSDDLKTAVVKISGSVEGGSPGTVVELEILSPTGSNVLKTSAKSSENGEFKANLRVENPRTLVPIHLRRSTTIHHYRQPPGPTSIPNQENSDSDACVSYNIN